MRAVKASPDFAVTVTRQISSSVMETAVAVHGAFREAQRQAMRAEQLSVAARSAPDVNTPSDEDVRPDLPTVPAHLRLVGIVDDPKQAVVECPGYYIIDRYCYACGVVVGPDEMVSHFHWGDAQVKHRANRLSMYEFLHQCRRCGGIYDFSSFTVHDAICQKRHPDGRQESKNSSELRRYLE